MLHSLDLSRRRKINHKQSDDIQAADVMIIAYFAQWKPAIHDKTLWQVKAFETVMNRDKMSKSGTFTLPVICVTVQQKMASCAALIENPCPKSFKHFNCLLPFYKRLL
jgi:hypothetical protein